MKINKNYFLSKKQKEKNTIVMPRRVNSISELLNCIDGNYKLIISDDNRINKKIIKIHNHYSRKFVMRVISMIIINSFNISFLIISIISNKSGSPVMSPKDAILFFILFGLISNAITQLCLFPTNPISNYELKRFKNKLVLVKIFGKNSYNSSYERLYLD
jgi:hypothetical protein